MKISKLRRTLAVFLSALMLTLCAPMSAFTAFAEETISSISYTFNAAKIPELTADADVPVSRSVSAGNGSAEQIVLVSEGNVSYTLYWAEYSGSDWVALNYESDNGAKFEAGKKYGYGVFCSCDINSYEFANDVALTGNFDGNVKKYSYGGGMFGFILELGTIDEINAASGNGGSSTGSTVSVSDIINGNVSQVSINDIIRRDKTAYTVNNTTLHPEANVFLFFAANDYSYDDPSQWIEEVPYTGLAYTGLEPQGTTFTIPANDSALPGSKGTTAGRAWIVKDVGIVWDCASVLFVSDGVYNITLNYQDDGTTDNEVKYTEGGKLANLPTPTREGYTFDGWFDTATDGNPVTTSTVFTQDTTIYAHWTQAAPTGNTVTLKPNGGTLSGEDTATTNASGCFETLPTAPTRTGYTFGGWYTDATKGTKVTTSTQLEDGATIYAQWYDDEVSGTKPVSLLETVQLNPISEDENETKFVFSGIPELSQAEIDAGFKYVYAMAPDPTAVEDAASKNQVFNDGGYNRNDLMIGVTYTNDITDNLQIELDTLSIVCFMKVNTNKTFSGKYHIFAEKDFAAGKAAASTGNTITLDPNDGTLNGDATATISDEGKLNSLPADPTYTGHAFIGWFTTVNGGTKVDTTTTLSNGDTIYAQWVDISGTIPLLNATLDPVSGNTYKFNGLTALTEDELALGYRYYYNIYTPEESDHETPESLQEAAQEDIRDTVDQSIGGVNNIFITEDSPYIELPSSMEITIPSLSSISIQKVNLNYHYEDSSEILYMLSFNELVVEPASTDDTIKEVTITVDTSKLPKLIGGQTASGVYVNYLKAFTLSEGVSFENVFGFFDSDNNYTTKVVAGKDYYMYTSIRPTDLTKVFDDSVTIKTIGGTTQVELANITENKHIRINYYLGKAYEAETPENKAEKAASDIDLALDSLKPTNDTVKNDVQKIVDENKGDTEATVTTFTLTPATTEADGSLKVKVTVSDGTNTETVEKTYTIDKLPAAPENKAEKAAEDIDTALDDLVPTNDTAKDDVQKIVDENKGDTTATVTTFELTPATEEEEGSLTVTVTISDGTNTETVEKTYVIPALGAGNIKIEGSDNNVGGAGVENAEEAKAAVEITEEEQALIDSGYDLTIVLNVENADETVSDNDKALTESAVEESKEEVVIGMYLDITLLKKIGSSETALTETSAPISIAFEMPESLVNGDEFVTRKYFVIRVHDGKTEIIPCEYDPETGKATFETDKFSSYAIAYTDSEDPIPAFVERLYKYMLGRHSDPVGKANHVANLRNGETAVKVSFDFVYSDEFKNMGLSNEEIAERLYLTFLDRSPDAAGLADWTATLDGGCSVGHLFYGFTQSKEFTELCEEYGIVRGDWTVMETRDVSSKLTAFVSRLYTKALNRSYDVDGLNNHTANYIENHDLYQLAYDFIFSSEFIEKDPSDEDFVDTMYRTFFDREGDPDGRADWLGRIKSGCSREEVLAGFVGSQECADLVAKFGI